MHSANRGNRYRDFFAATQKMKSDSSCEPTSAKCTMPSTQSKLERHGFSSPPRRRCRPTPAQLPQRVQVRGTEFSSQKFVGDAELLRTTGTFPWKTCRPRCATKWNESACRPQNNLHLFIELWITLSA